jgi:UDP-N-acetylglucosamine 2-epimerase
VHPIAIVAYHPVALLADTNAETEELFAALAQLSHQLIFCHPNADAGSRALSGHIQSLLAQRGSGHFFTNLSPIEYWSLLQHVDLMVGNSSSGIMESASFALPTVNVGMRHKEESGPECIRRRATGDIRSAAVTEGRDAVISRVSVGNDQSVWRWPRSRTYRAGANHRAAT